MQSDVSAALAAFPSQRTAIERRVGREQTIDLGNRLVADEAIFSYPKPDGFADADWNATLDAVVRGDLEALYRAAVWAEPELRMEQGLHAFFVRSTVDGFWNPPIAFLIHGVHSPRVAHNTILCSAWGDMHQGITRADSIPRGIGDVFLTAAPRLHDGDFGP